MRSGLAGCSSLAWIRILDLVRNQLEHTGSLAPVLSTLQGLDTPRLVRERCQQKEYVAAILSRGMRERCRQKEHVAAILSRGMRERCR